MVESHTHEFMPTCIAYVHIYIDTHTSTHTHTHTHKHFRWACNFCGNISTSEELKGANGLEHKDLKDAVVEYVEVLPFICALIHVYVIFALSVCVFVDESSACIFVCVCLYVCVCVYTYIYIHTYIYIYIHT
jgi:hypothetical protein